MLALAWCAPPDEDDFLEDMEAQGYSLDPPDPHACRLTLEAVASCQQLQQVDLQFFMPLSTSFYRNQ